MSENSRSTKSNAAVAFGRFRISPRSRQLVAGEKVIPLGSRAFDILLALVEAEGQLVSKDTLRKRIWGPGTNVDDHNISAQIWSIRRALGEEGRLIVNDRGRGYRFTGPISWELRGRTPPTAGAGPHGVTSEVAQTNIAPPLSALIGRESELSVLSELLRTHRLVTLTGLGGVGKTRLAIEVARLVLPSFPSGVWLAELAAVADSDELIAGTIAKALGLSIGPHHDLEQCLKSLSADPVLLVIDNCEHVVDVVAHFVEMMLRSVPSLRLLVTSREPLEVEGERVYRVSPLEVPPPGVLKADQVLKYSAVRLFVHRAQAIDARFLLTDETVAIVGTICRRLDGIPLAIELAAGRVETLGVVEVANGLEDRFRLLTGGRRTALDRHQTLRATLDWSYRLLEEPEQTILRRLGIFANGFTLSAARALVVGGEVDYVEVADLVTSLAKKSLVSADVQRTSPRYCLLETTRAYALEKLADSGEFALVASRHAAHFRDLLEGMEQGWTAILAPELLEYASEIDNIRAALEWSFGPDGELETGIALAGASIPLWNLLSLLGECRDWAERGLRRLAQSALSPRYEMLLQAALGMSLMWARGPVSETRAAWERSLAVAKELSDSEYQVRALYGLWVFHVRVGEFRQALDFAEQLTSIAENVGDSSGILTGHRVTGVSLHFLGEQMRAGSALQAVIESQPQGKALHHSFVMRTGVDQRVAALACQARIYWVNGFPDRAWQAALAGVEEASTSGHANSLCVALAEGPCLVGTLRGDVAAVDKFAVTLIEHAEKHRLHPFRAFAKAFRSWVLINRGEIERGYSLLQTAQGLLHHNSADLGHANIALTGVIFYGALAEISRRNGPTEDARRVIAGALDRSRQNGGCWCMAELLRLEGEFVLASAVTGASEIAEKAFMESIAIAHREGTRSWELRTAMSVARLWCTENRADEARTVLGEIYGMFDEGFGTADLRTAGAMIEKLSRR